MVVVLLLFFAISVPLTFLGAFYGYKKDSLEDPVKTSDIPRKIPEQPWYMNTFVGMLMGGVLPFGAVFVELFFILNSLWLDQYYYIFGFLGIVLVILLVTCAEITVVLLYFQLCGEDYHWQWRSLLTSGSCAFYLFVYSLFSFSGKVELDMTATTSVVGYFASLAFVRKIYGSVKVD
eukprot:maker-scaffold_61-snap-gene-0.8-mRNA-1 protein AED:0.07 eAED:0.07 QI:0/0/0/1/0/0/2/0/176